MTPNVSIVVVRGDHILSDPRNARPINRTPTRIPCLTLCNQTASRYRRVRPYAKPAARLKGATVAVTATSRNAMNQISAYGAVGSTENSKPPSATHAGTATEIAINTPGDGRKAANVDRRVGGTGGTGAHSSGLIGVTSGVGLREFLNRANEASRSPIRPNASHETVRFARRGSAPDPETSRATNGAERRRRGSTAFTTRIPIAVPSGVMGGAGLAPGLHWRSRSVSRMTRASTSTMTPSPPAPSGRDEAPRMTGDPDAVTDPPRSWFRVLAFSITTPPDPVSRVLPTFFIQTDRVRDAYGADPNPLSGANSQLPSRPRSSDGYACNRHEHGQVNSGNPEEAHWFNSRRPGFRPMTLFAPDL